MQVKSATFVASAAKFNQCPAEGIPEYAFAGRSNVGKSSLINMLTGTKNLARTSADPGKTRLLNFFLINNLWYLVDVPGYGYARISKSQRENWTRMVQEYLKNRKSLFYTFLLIDSRHKPLKSDLDFIHWMGASGIPFCLVFTKCDKVSGNELAANASAYRSLLKETWEELPPMFFTSAAKKSGRDELLSFISETTKSFSEFLNP